MTDDGGWSHATHSVASLERVERASDRSADVHAARRSAAAFGSGGGPGLGDTVREFVRRYGWRAYALPVLVVVTVVALMTAKNDPKPAAQATQQLPQVHTSSTGTAAPPVAPTKLPLKSDVTGGVAGAALAVGQLPKGGPYTKKGTGEFRTIPGTTKVIGSSGPLFRYKVEIEKGITGVDVARFSAAVDKTLDDTRSWSGHGKRLERVSSGAADFSISLTSAMTVRTYCGYDIPVETSCYAPDGTAGLPGNRVVLNVARWVRGAAAYIGDLPTYRIYMINHEVGHALGHQHAHSCLPGGLAPVMMQQTYGLKSATTKQICQANPWPFPPGVSGAPGAEAADTNQNNEYYMGD